MVRSLSLFCIISYAFWSFVSGQIEVNPSQNRRQTPVTRLLSDLEGLVLGVDETIHRLTAPDNFRNIDQKNIAQKSEDVGLNPSEKDESNQQINYFDKVRENYEQLSKRIQQSLENPSEIFKVPELVHLNFQNKGQKSFIDLSSPFLNIKVSGKSTVPKVDTNEAKSGSTVPQLPMLDLPDLSGRIKIGGSNEKPINVAIDEIQERESRPNKLRKPIHNLNNENDRRDKPQEGKVKTPYQRRTNTENILPFVNEITGDQGQSRILGDLLFSEESFDRYIRMNLERFGKLLFDTSILPASVIETIRGVTRNPFVSSLTRRNNGLHPKPVNSESKFFLNKRSGSLDSHQASAVDQENDQNSRVTRNPFASSLNRRNNGLYPKPVNSESKVFLNKRSGSLDSYQASAVDKGNDQNSRIILAFTQGGVPMKLKLNDNLENPLEYLNEILSIAGIQLNIPVDSGKGNNPVGNNILQLGSDISGTESKVLYLDTTDEKQFQSFLKALQKARRN